MLRLEILGQKNEILSTHAIRDQELTLLGHSPSAHVHLSGQGIAPLHVAIRAGASPVIMDLGGPTPLRINGKESIEHAIIDDSTTLDIGSRRLRIVRNRLTTPDWRTQQWVPVNDRRQGPRGNDTTPLIRVRLYLKGVPQDVINAHRSISLDERHGLNKYFKFLWFEGGQAKAQLPSEWIALGGRIQEGTGKTMPLSQWASAFSLERDTVYRVFAGKYMAEILIAGGAPRLIGATRPDFLPKDLRKPLGVSFLSVLAIFGLWTLLMSRSAVKVEEPYQTYARIQNVPVEKIFEPGPSSEQTEGGGSGSQSQETTAPRAGAPSKLASALTGGLKNLVGNVLSQSKSTNAVVSESGVGAAAIAKAAVGKLADVGQGTAAVAGAAKLGSLNIAGASKGFGGGSGLGLGTSQGNGISAGVGQGIGKGNYKLVEEESITDGGLDKSVINAVIQNNLNQIKYCYERQLVAEPDLFGKVVMTWHITASGSVEGAAVKNTTLNSAPVEQCMSHKISGWKFPQPKNGTQVTVTYPFLFKSTK